MSALRPVFRFILGVAIFALVWEAAARTGLAPQNLFPTVGQIGRALVELSRSGELWAAAGATLARAALGLAIASVLAVLLGLAATMSRKIRQALAPFVDICRTLPPPALAPLLIFALGLNERMFLTVIVFAAIWPIYVACVAGFGGTEPLPLMTARSFGASDRWQLFNVRLPSALPSIFTGIRVGLGLSLMATIATEMIAGSSGLGFLLFDTAFSLRIPEMYATLLAAGFLGVLFNAALHLLKQPLVSWHTLQTELKSS